MTQEEKAKAYDDALERASKLRVQNPFDTVSQMMEHIFPELAESEDERIRTFLHHTFTAQYLSEDKLSTWHGEPVVNILSWLEKQGNKSEEYVFRPTAGCTIDEAAQQAVDKAANGENIVFSFNGFYIKIYNNTTINDIINSYNDFCKNNVRKTQNDVMKMK